MTAPGVRLRPSRFSLARVDQVRPINVGYANFDVPAEYSGELVRHDESLFVSVTGVSDIEPALTVCPPVVADDPNAVQFRREAAAVLDGPVPPLWELRKQALFTEPFSVWEIPFRGIKRTRTDMVLLILKGLDTSAAKQVRFCEGASVDAIIFVRSHLTEVRIIEKRTGIEQSFLIMAHGERSAVELASTLARSYRFIALASGEGSLLAALAATGIRQRLSEKAAHPAEESRRLEAVADEVRARRANRRERQDR